MNIIERLKQGYLTENAEQTIQIAREFALNIPDDAMVVLEGDLGVGKTTFVRGLALASGIDQPITSPSFNIFNYYTGKKRHLLHIDAYRLNSDTQLNDLLLDEFMTSPYLMAVEWPKDFSKFRSAHYTIILSIINEFHHFIKLA